MTTPSATQARSGPDITAREALFRIMQLLGRAGAELAEAQQAVAERLRDLPLTETEMRRLQKLDLATQTVDSVATVLQNLLSLTPARLADSISLPRLREGITLGEVMHILNGEEPPAPPAEAGHMDFF